MTIEEYQNKVKRTVRNSLNDEEKLKNFCLGIGGEVGELLDLFKKYLYHGHKLDENKVKNEMGDILWYLANISNVCGFDLKEIMKLNIDKLWKRYPNGFTKEDSINRIS